MSSSEFPSPLSSLRVLDFTTLLPGPFATLLLADLGADVVRVEAPDRPDLARFLPPFDGDVSAWHGLLNRNKRSITLDLKQPGAAEVVQRLVQRYDIVVEQFRPGVMDRLGVGYDALRAANPRLIYCAITGYGQTGPYRERAGHDLNFLALAGILSHSGRVESGPPGLGVQVADVGGGSFGAITGILAAVIQRQLSGVGQMVDVSMFDLALAWNSLPTAEYLASGENPTYESGLLNGGTLYDTYRTADGRYLAVASLEEKFWQGFCQAIDRPDLADKGIFGPGGSQAYVKAEIAAVIAQRSLADWQAVFAPLDVCVEPVLTVEEALAHPQTAARGLLVETPRGDGTTQRQVAHPLRFSASQPAYRHIGPPLGAHTAEVLAETDYTDRELAALQGGGVLG
ncbi:MAG TPA: CaiB/BaiF CoA-transferase family protein [Anaerolineae bacterium]|nr:CaiB/BaiF CoA-transferase family protein [Anaerolineae bacterium]